MVLGPRLPDVPLVETIQKIREGSASRRVSILVMIPASEPPGTEGVVLGAGANAALRRPLDRFVLESWVSKLVDVPNRVLARIPVHVQVVGSRHGAPGEHFYGLSRNLSVHGMLLASPVRIEAAGPRPGDRPAGGRGARARAGARRARGARGRAGRTSGYGIEFLFLPEAAQRVIDRMVRREAPREPPRSLWAPGAIQSTVRRDDWIYEITEPARTDSGFLVEIRRGAREGWRPGRASPFYVVEDRSPEAALEAAREFVQRHG